MPASIPLVPWNPVVWESAVRIIAREYTAQTIFDLVTESDEDAVIAALVADFTNPTTMTGAARFLAFPAGERVTGNGAGLILGPFCFGTAPTRFSDGQRGVWYGASTELTAVAERAYHTNRVFQESNTPPTVVQMAVIEAKLDGVLADIRGRQTDLAALYNKSEYSASQVFGDEQYQRGAYGVVYDSLRKNRGQCVAVFRPSILREAQVTHLTEWVWDGSKLNTAR